RTRHRTGDPMSASTKIPDFTTLPRATRRDATATASAAAGRNTPEGIALQGHYGLDAVEGLDHLATMPGLPPYLRGPYSSMYAARPWTVRQYAGFSTAEASNAFYRRNLEAGQRGLSIAFDLATHRG